MITYLLFFCKFFYSVLNASTGSFLLAIFEGIRPAIIVKIIEIITKIIAPPTGRLAIFEIFVKAFIIMFTGIVIKTVMPIPKTPAINPIINVSALNTLEISFLDAPIAL